MYLIEVIQEQIKRAYKKLLMRADTFQFWVVTGGTREERKNFLKNTTIQLHKHKSRSLFAKIALSDLFQINSIFAYNFWVSVSIAILMPSLNA